MGFFDACEVRLEVFFQPRVHLLVLLHEGYLIAEAKAVLQEERAPDALQLPLDHDANTIAENVSLIHVVRREDDNAILFVGLEHVPKVPSRSEIHSSSRLVKHHELGAAAEGDAD